MTQLRGEELSALYPKAKSFDELEAERKARLLASRPKFVSIKISTWMILMPTLILLSYELILVLMKDSVASAALASVSFSILIGMFVFAVICYLCARIRDVATRVFCYPSRLYGTVTFLLFLIYVIVALLMSNQLYNLVTLTATLLSSIVISIIAIETILRRQKL